MAKDSELARAGIAEWLDAQEGFATRRERMHDEIAADPSRAIAWFEEAFRLGLEAAAPRAGKLAGAALDEWVRERRAYADAARRFPENTCPASRHLHLMADSLAEEETYPILQDDPAHVAGSIYGVVAALWEARDRIAELEAKAGDGRNGPKT